MNAPNAVHASEAEGVEEAEEVVEAEEAVEPLEVVEDVEDVEVEADEADEEVVAGVEAAGAEDVSSSLNNPNILSRRSPSSFGSLRHPGRENFR